MADAGVPCRAQAETTLLLAGPSEPLVRQYAGALTRCLHGLAAAVGTMAPNVEASPSDGCDDGNGDGCGGDNGGDGEGACCECLVFVAGGGAVECCLAQQLEELQVSGAAAASQGFRLG